MKIIAAEKDIKYDIEMASQNLYLLDKWEQAHLVIHRANIYTSICVRVSMCHCNNVHPHTMDKRKARSLYVQRLQNFSLHICLLRDYCHS